MPVTKTKQKKEAPKKAAAKKAVKKAAPKKAVAKKKAARKVSKKAAPKKTAAKKSSQPRTKPTPNNKTTSQPVPQNINKLQITDPVESIRIRMYCHGFGDCFLLQFISKGKVVYKMLIDCGQLTGSTEPLANAIESIKQDCGGKLDLVVQTHEHKDHISGFNLKGKDKKLLWEDIDVDTVWLAWTENTGTQGDALARQLKKMQDKKKAALTRAVALYDKHINNAKIKADMHNQYLGVDYYAAQQRYSTALQQILNFFDISGDEIKNSLRLKNDSLGLTMKDAMGYFVKRRKEKGKPDIFFWNPGECATEQQTGIKGVNFFFLGPPKDYKKLQVMEDKKHVEMYLAEMGLSDNFYLPLTNGANGSDVLSPFNRKYFLEKDELSPEEKKNPLHVWNLYNASGAEWRTIEVDWLNNAGALALNLDTYTNNTSLVIAIEIGKDKVLLFAADAQIGNWLSWTETVSGTDPTPRLQWTYQKEGKERTIAAKDLLKNTVFYKVGHHASHNATARKHGLEMMEREELIAMIPVDEEVAKKQGKKGWEMPAGDLYERLKQKTKGRIIRADKGNILTNKTENVPDNVKGTRAEQNEFNGKVTYSQQTIKTDDGRVRPLYVEYEIKA